MSFVVCASSHSAGAPFFLSETRKCYFLCKIAEENVLAPAQSPGHAQRGETEDDHVTKDASVVDPSPLHHAHDPGHTPNPGHAVGKDEDVLGRARPVGLLRTTDLAGHHSDAVGRHHQEGGRRQEEDRPHVEGTVTFCKTFCFLTRTK